MAVNALNAPAHVVAPKMPIGSGQGAPNQAPSLAFLGGGGLQDHRLPWNTANSQTGAAIVGWAGNGFRQLVAQAPSTIATANIVASANATSATLSLVSSSAAGITVVPAGGFLCLPSLNVVPAGALCIDGLPTPLRFGSLPNSSFTCLYDPTTAISRGISVTAAASATATSATISGWDYYGYPLTQTVTVTAGSTVATKKTFKFIKSAVLNAADATHAYSVGTADIFGFPTYTTEFPDFLGYWNNALLVTGSSTGGAAFVVPDNTAPATAATGDVRGTAGPFSASASDGTKRLVLFAQVTPNRLASASGPTIGVFGQPQV